MAKTKAPKVVPNETWKKLANKFDPKVVGLLPKITCPSCVQSKTKHCNYHNKSECADCKAYISSAHMHLDYVGHAAVTDRLNTVVGPPNWNWEPLAFDAGGLPLLDRNGNLWIKLTVMNVTKLGYGDGSNSIKELIGDAIRNAAMRFGVALDLWSKDELESTIESPENKNEKPTNQLSKRPPAGSMNSRAYAEGMMTSGQRKHIFSLLSKNGISKEQMPAILEFDFGIQENQPISYDVARHIIDRLKTESQKGSSR